FTEKINIMLGIETQLLPRKILIRVWLKRRGCLGDVTLPFSGPETFVALPRKIPTFIFMVAAGLA
ncbi:MAG: hypothetical protein ACPGN3_17895, partial [Opitutales bacterium]